MINDLHLILLMRFLKDVPKNPLLVAEISNPIYRWRIFSNSLQNPTNGAKKVPKIYIFYI